MLKLYVWKPETPIPEFECSDSKINEYYNNRLQTDIDVRACRAYFLYQDDKLIGFFTLLPHSIQNTNNHIIRKREHKGMGKWLSGVLLGHFAIDINFAGKYFTPDVKYSKILMRCALDSFIRVVNNFCGVALLLNPINRQVCDKFYKKEYGELFKPYPTKDDYMFVRTVDVLQLLDKSI